MCPVKSKNRESYWTRYFARMEEIGEAAGIFLRGKTADTFSLKRKHKEGERLYLHATEIAQAKIRIDG
jgi:hypothetical protein